MKAIRLAIASTLLLVLAAANATAQGKPVLVDGKWLAGHLTDRAVAVVHVVQSPFEYHAGHLPGARLLPLSAVSVNMDGLTAQLAPPAQVDSVLESLGVSDGQHVVLYGQPLAVARAFVTLERFGLKGSVSVLDGGLDLWRESGRPTTREVTAVKPGSFTPRVDDTVVDAAWISANGQKAGTKVLDARAPEFYLGVTPGATARAGHIPGATNLPFSSLTGELTTMRETGKIRRLFEQAGVGKGDSVVTYCHIGMQASLLYFAARTLGIPVRIYDGSWEDWAKRSELPVVVEKP
ncbi:MAG: sulfurtransferase [Cytophagaceae bacterium]|nr:sulfurtransferase [Gemmatimonadaceae bacterium]